MMLPSKLRIKSSFSEQNSTRQSFIVLYMVCFYIFLVIERPWESIRYLHGIPIEHFYAIAMILVAILNNKFKIIQSPTNKWVYSLLALHFILSPFAFSTQYALDTGIEYAKMVVLYLLILSVVEDEESLKVLVKAFVFTMIFYVLHSFSEFQNGRHVYRMGIVRMIGVDNTFDAPNSFGASIVLSLPFVYALLRTEVNHWLKKIYYGYFGLAIVCVVLTGSRTSFVALMFALFLLVIKQSGKRKIKFFIIAVLSVSLIWSAMPADKQVRIETLWDKDAGPANAHESAEGRVEGWKASWEMFKDSPLTGVGAGGKNFMGYRVTKGDGVHLQSHILYGQVLAELGIFGAFAFAGLVFSTIKSSLISRRQLVPENLNGSFCHALGGAIIACVLLLFVFGIAGHNFYRPMWLWLAAWSGCLLNINQRTEKCEKISQKGSLCQK